MPDYNECRPYESLDNMTPMEYRAKEKAGRLFRKAKLSFAILRPFCFCHDSDLLTHGSWGREALDFLGDYQCCSRLCGVIQEGLFYLARFLGRSIRKSLLLDFH